MVARSKNGEVTSFPVTETIHKDSICYVTQTPAQIPEELRQQAQAMAEKAVSCLEGASPCPDEQRACSLRAARLQQAPGHAVT